MPYAGELYALLTACFWAGSSIAFTAATRRIGSVQVNTSRLLLAALYLAALIAVLRLPVDLSSTQALFLAISGTIGFTLGDSFLFRAFRLIGARIAMLVMSLAPAFAALLGFFLLGERLSWLDLLGMTVTLGGIALVVLGRRPAGEEDPLPHHIARGGLVLALLGAACQGGGLVFAKLAFREGEINGFVATFVRVLSAIAVLLPAAALSGRYRRPVAALRSDRQALWGTVAGSIFGPFLGVTCSLMAIQRTDVGIAATLMATTPIVMLPIARFIQREHIGWRAVVGAVVATLGVGMLFLG